MNTLRGFLLRTLCLAILLFPELTVAQQLRPVELPAPQTTGGMPSMQALKVRHSTRDFSSRKLSIQVLSNLLWAVFGINRQGIEIYVAAAGGLYVYNAKSNRLNPVMEKDVLSATGTQSFVGAPVDLVSVADLTKVGASNTEDQGIYMGADTGVIAQDVYLFCASEGLGVVVRGSVNRPTLAKTMNMVPTRELFLAQTVGYPR